MGIGIEKSDKFKFVEHLYFRINDCEYYPCHKGADELNCLFCYCPLYKLENCPGQYEMKESKGRTIRTCLDCSFPHIPENYDKMIEILKANL